MSRRCFSVSLLLWWTALYVQVNCKKLLETTSWETLPLNTGAQLADALMNPSVTLIELHSDIVLQHTDFARYQLPIVVRRNLTIQGDIAYRQLDFNYVYNKVRLAADVVLTFRGLYTLNARAKSFALIPGLDLLVSTRPGETATVLFQDGLHETGLCYATSSQSNIAHYASRPGFLPAGIQRTLHGVPQEGCKNTTNTPGWDRCWSSRSLYADFGLASFDLDLKDDTGATPETLDVGSFQRAKRLVNYALWFLNETMLCRRLESEECIRQLGVIGCGWRAARELPPMKPDPEPEVDPPPPAPVEVPGSKPAVLPLALGITGGVLALVILLGLVLLWRRQKRYPDCWKRPNSPVEETAAAALHALDDAITISIDPTAERKSHQSRDGDGDGHNEAVGLPTGNLGLTTGCTKVISTEVQPYTKTEAGQRLQSLCNIPAAVTFKSPQRPDFNLNIRLRHDDGAASVGVAGAAEKMANRSLSAASIGSLPPGSSLGTDGSGTGSDVRSNGRGAAADATASVDAAAAAVDGPEAEELRLLGGVLGRGAFGKVVLGEYQGRSVAVKMMEFGGLGTAEMGALIRKHVGQKEGREQQDIKQQRQQEGARDGPQPDSEDKARVGSDSPDHGIAKEELKALLKAFRQEIEVLGRCQHPNVVRLLAACTSPPQLCLVMELAETNLARMLHGASGEKGQLPLQAADRLLPLPKVLHIATEIALGLEYLHPTIIHRDLKPANVLIFGVDSAKPHAKIGDFGLSRLRSTVRMTQNPEVGTPPYMAPECFELNNFVVTHRADIYSLAVVMYEMLSGEQPWPRASITEIAFNVTLKGNRPPLSSVSCDRCPRKLRNLIVQCWDQDPERRPAAAEVVKQLLLIQEMMNHCALATPGQRGGLSAALSGQTDVANASAAGAQPDRRLGTEPPEPSAADAE